MMFTGYSEQDATAIRLVVEREVGRDLSEDDGFADLLAAISGAAFAYVFRPPPAPRSAELGDAMADAKRLRSSLRTAENSSGLLVAFMPTVDTGGHGVDVEAARDAAKEWLAGLDRLIDGLSREISALPIRKGRPPLIARNVFWSMLEMLWRRDIGGGGPGKVGDEWTGGVVDFIHAASAPLMPADECTSSRIGDFLRAQKKSPTFSVVE
ncbi:hypothetical protein GVN24_27400 [Rhizobium sp. CRIBSB]|nr:hypothetical protein [Rhizobium sp. CRIBSB]